MAGFELVATAECVLGALPGGPHGGIRRNVGAVGFIGFMQPFRSLLRDAVCPERTSGIWSGNDKYSYNCIHLPVFM